LGELNKFKGEKMIRKNAKNQKQVILINGLSRRQKRAILNGFDSEVVLEFKKCALVAKANKLTQTSLIDFINLNQVSEIYSDFVMGEFFLHYKKDGVKIKTKDDVDNVVGRVFYTRPMYVKKGEPLIFGVVKSQFKKLINSFSGDKIMMNQVIFLGELESVKIRDDLIIHGTGLACVEVGENKSAVLLKDFKNI